MVVKSCHNFAVQKFDFDDKFNTNLSFGIKASGKIIGINSGLTRYGVLLFFRIFRFYINSDGNYKYEVVTEGVVREQKTHGFEEIDMSVDIKCQSIADSQKINHYLLWMSVTDWFGDPLFEKVVLFSRAPSKCDFYTRKTSWNYDIKKQLSNDQA